MPNLTAAREMTQTDWELFEEEYQDYNLWLDEQQAEEMAYLDDMYRYHLEEDESDDPAFPF